MRARPFAGLCVFATGTLLAVAADARSKDQPNIVAGWLAVAQAQPQALRIAEGSWSPAVRFRPQALSALDADAIGAQDGKRRIARGARMIAITGLRGVQCELERPRGDHSVGCVEDKDGDGRFDSFFAISHGNPFLFSAWRLPRSKDLAIAPVTLSPAGGEADFIAEMVIFYRNRSEMRGISYFELCVLRADNRNTWGDKSQARGCLPAIAISDTEFPRLVVRFGRMIRFETREGESAIVTVTGNAQDIPVRL